MAVQRHVMTLRKMDASLLLHGLRVQDDAEGITGGLVPNEAQNCTCVLLVAVWLRHKHWLPRQFTGHILAFPLPNFVAVVVLLRQAKHAVVINDAPAVLMPDTIDLWVDLRLVEAIVRPAGAGALSRPDVHGEPSDLSTTTTPILDVTRSCLSQREAHRRFVVADNVEVNNLVLAGWSTRFLKRVNDVEEEKRIRLEGLGLFACDSVDDADSRRALWLPSVVVVEVAFVDTIHQPSRLRIEHAIPVQRVWNLDHDDVLLRQGDGVDRGRILRRDATNQAALNRCPGSLRGIRHHREDNILRLEAHVLRADAELDRACHPLTCVLVDMRLCVEDQRTSLH
mmetsp:Transcript_114545/g.160853  ORF Transcript_114545/g.160853 Transcript_114545/m.160853 type:complete len:339 (-) Transcript_114545:885-1901(-)